MTARGARIVTSASESRPFNSDTKLHEALSSSSYDCVNVRASSALPVTNDGGQLHNQFLDNDAGRDRSLDCEPMQLTHLPNARKASPSSPNVLGCQHD